MKKGVLLMNWIRTPGGEFLNFDYFTAILNGKNEDEDVLFMRDSAGHMYNFQGDDRKAILKFMEGETSHGFVTRLDKV